MSSHGINKVILIGHLGQDPDPRPITNGGSMTLLSLATSERWQNKQTGEPVERTEWHRVVLFGKLAEIAARYLKKGSQVYLEGKLQTRKWQDQQGQDRYTTEVVVDISGTLQMLGGRNQQQGDEQLVARGQSSSWQSTHPSSGYTASSTSQVVAAAAATPTWSGSPAPTATPKEQTSQGSSSDWFNDEVPF